MMTETISNPDLLMARILELVNAERGSPEANRAIENIQECLKIYRDLEMRFEVATEEIRRLKAMQPQPIQEMDALAKRIFAKSDL